MTHLLGHYLVVQKAKKENKESKRIFGENRASRVSDFNHNISGNISAVSDCVRTSNVRRANGARRSRGVPLLRERWPNVVERRA